MTESEAIEAIQFDLKIGGEIHSQVLRDAIDVAIKALEEVQKYREIGSIEECRASREKQIAKKPDFTEDKEFALCHCCNGKGLLNKQKYCDNCGQKLDWSDENERS